MQIDNTSVPIVFICDKNYIMPTVVAITSLYKNQKKNANYNINVIASDCTDKDLEPLKLLNNVNIIPIKNPHIHLGLGHEYVTKTSLLKFDIANILQNYDKALYIDSDVLILKDLTELCNINIEDVYAGVVEDLMAEHYYKDNKRIGYVNYFNSGMMLLNLQKIRLDNIREKLILTKKELNIDRYQDQDSFNIVFANKVKYLPLKYNYLYSYDLSMNRELKKKYCKNKEKTILHVTWIKPWKYLDLPITRLWDKYYKLTSYKKQKLSRDRMFKNKFLGHERTDNAIILHIFGRVFIFLK